MGVLKDRVKLRYSADGKTLEGRLTFQYTLPDGTVAFDGASQIKLIRVRVETSALSSPVRPQEGSFS